MNLAFILAVFATGLTAVIVSGGYGSQMSLFSSAFFSAGYSSLEPPLVGSGPLHGSISVHVFLALIFVVNVILTTVQQQERRS